MVQLLALAWLAARVTSAIDLKNAFWRGLAFGFGTFCAGVGWIYISLHVYAELSMVLAALATGLLAFGLSVAPAMAGALTAALKPTQGCGDGLPGLANPQNDAGAPFRFAACWTLFELGRGYAFSGFPWLASGYAHVDSPLAGWAPILGVYGVTAAGAVVSASVAAFVQSIRSRVDWKQAAVPLAIAALTLGSGAILRQIEWVQPHGNPLTVRLLQGNVSQDMKFDPERALRAIERYRELTEDGDATLTVMPETAWVVAWLEAPREERERLLALGKAQHRWIALGIPLPVADPWRVALLSLEDGVTNSVVLIGPRSAETSRFAGRYDKRHLVPFGEFIPVGFRWFVDLMVMPMGDFARGSEDPEPQQVADQRVAFNICYEDLFGEELTGRINQGATVLINVSNIAWFGGSHALPQHLQISRMRTLELGRPMLRATNTGVTAAIDHRARVLAELPIQIEGALDTQTQGTVGVTPYVRLGNLAILLICLSILGLCLLTNRALVRRPGAGI
jgi:apolipoprotein N-acyltransferase